MCKVLVTGATGFIGQYVVTALLRRGCSVVATSANQKKAASMPWYNNVGYIPFRIEDQEPGVDYYQFFQRPDLLVHLAWEGLPNYKADFHTLVNMPRHLSFINNLVSNGLSDVTVTGTCFEYGMQEGALHEEQPVYPANPYATAKNELRIALEKQQLQTPFNLKWARLFYMYGNGQSPNSLLSQLDRALATGESVFNMSGGQQMRDFLPVKKVADYIVAIAMQTKVTGIINVCSGQPVTVQHFVENYLAMQHQQIKLNLGFYPYPDYEPMSFWGDTTKLKTIPLYA